jgi:hypothetical protein
MTTLSVGGPFGVVTTSTGVPQVNASTVATQAFIVRKVYGDVVLSPQTVLTATSSTIAHMGNFISRNPEG